MRASFRRLVLFCISTCLLLLVAACSQPPAPVEQNKKVEAYTRPAVVRVIAYNAADFTITGELAQYVGTSKITEYDGGTGSGAVISSNGYIVTNAHVVEAIHKEETEAYEAMYNILLADLYARFKQINPATADADIQHVQTYFDQYVKLENFERVSMVILPGGDEQTFDIKSYGKPIGEGKDVAILKINAKDLPVISVDDTDGDGSAVSSAIQFAGYPGKADLDGFLDEKSQLEATYSTGTISVSQKIMKNGAPVIQLNANLNPGNSGGPVLSENGKMIGIATATSHEGIGWVIPSSTVMEFVRQAGAEVNQSTLITLLWQEGLDYYWEGYYSKAIPKFEEVRRLYDKHYSVSTYLAKSQKAMSEGANRIDWRDYYVYFAIGGAVLLLIILLMVVWTVQRSRKRKRSDNEEKDTENSRRE